MAYAPPDLSPAERAYLRPRLAANAVFQHVRWSTPADWSKTLGSAHPLDPEEVTGLRTELAELSRDNGLQAELGDASSLVRKACVSAYGKERRREARERGDRWFVWGPGRREWNRFAERIQLHVESLVVDEFLSTEQRSRCRLATVPAELV